MFVLIFWTPEVLFSLLTWTWARRVAPSLRRLGSTCRRCLLAPGGSLPVFLSPPSRCGALDALAGCDSASSAAFPWRMTSVGVSVFGVATVCRFASRRPIAALVGHVRLGPIAVFLVVQTSSLSACCVATRSMLAWSCICLVHSRSRSRRRLACLCCGLQLSHRAVLGAQVVACLRRGRCGSARLGVALSATDSLVAVLGSAWRSWASMLGRSAPYPLVLRCSASPVCSFCSASLQPLLLVVVAASAVGRRCSFCCWSSLQLLPLVVVAASAVGRRCFFRTANQLGVLMVPNRGVIAPFGRNSAY